MADRTYPDPDKTWFYPDPKEGEEYVQGQLFDPDAYGTVPAEETSDDLSKVEVVYPARTSYETCHTDWKDGWGEHTCFRPQGHKGQCWCDCGIQKFRKLGPDGKMQ